MQLRADCSYGFRGSMVAGGRQRQSFFGRGGRQDVHVGPERARRAAARVRGRLPSLLYTHPPLLVRCPLLLPPYSLFPSPLSVFRVTHAIPAASKSLPITACCVALLARRVRPPSQRCSTPTAGWSLAYPPAASPHTVPSPRKTATMPFRFIIS